MVKKPNREYSGDHSTCRAPLGDTMAIFKARGPGHSIDIAMARFRSSSPALGENADWCEGSLREWPTPEKAKGAAVLEGARLDG